MQVLGLLAGGQKSKQEKKEAHKAKRKAKKGAADSADRATLSKEGPTAEALAAVGATQMSQAAAERQAQIDKNRAAWRQRTQAAAPDAASAAGDVSGPSQQPGDDAGPSQPSGSDAGLSQQAGSDLAASGTHGTGNEAESAESAEDAGISSSEAEEDGELDTAGGAQVIIMHAFQTKLSTSL